MSFRPDRARGNVTADAQWAEFARAVAAKYTVLSEIGRGGMAVVLHATDVRHHRDVAIKLFRQEVSTAVESERFEREIQIAARLNHPHLLPLFDSGKAAGHLFYVMPLMRGETVRHHLQRDTTIDVPDAVRWITEVCGALDYAHRNGVVHRDIKPENILLSEGHAVVADFGIAHALDRAAGSTLTEMGVALGTPAYLSPEQALADSILDGRSDQYSLACVFFELLAGEPPFVAATSMMTITKHLSQAPPSIHALRADISDAIGRALERALAKHPDDRFASTSDFARALSLEPVAAVLVPDEEMVAVLDFTNISADPSVQWLSVGIAETIAVDLKRVDTIRVVRREHITRALKRLGRAIGSEADAMEVAQSAGARWLVWGGYQHAGERLRITPQFGDVHNGRMTPASKIDGAMADVFDMQDRIVREVLALLSVAAPLVDNVAKSGTATLSAYELYARSRQLQNEFTPTAMRESRALLHEAIVLDPQYALAFSGLGYSFAFGYIATSDPEDLTQAIRHLERAIQLDPSLGEAHAWMAYAYLRADRLDDAVFTGRHATSLEPDFHFAHYFYGLALAASSERGADQWWMRGEAVRAVLCAARLAPDAQPAHMVLVDLYLANGQYAAAAPYARRAIALETASKRTTLAFVGGHLAIAAVAAVQGDTTGARHAFQLAIDSYTTSSNMYACYGVAMARMGMGELSRRQGRYDEALIAARAVIELCVANPTRGSMGYLLTRAHLLAAKANAALGVVSEARRELAAADELLRTRRGYAFSYGISSNEGMASFDFASTYAELGKFDASMWWLERAFAASWNDHPSLRADPSFARMQGTSGLEQFIDRCKARGQHEESSGAFDTITFDTPRGDT